MAEPAFAAVILKVMEEPTTLFTLMYEAPLKPVFVVSVTQSKEQASVSASPADTHAVLPVVPATQRPQLSSLAVPLAVLLQSVGVTAPA